MEKSGELEVEDFKRPPLKCWGKGKAGPRNVPGWCYVNQAC